MIPMASKDHGHQHFLILTSKMLTIFLQDSSPQMALTMKKETSSVAFSIEGKVEKQAEAVLSLLSLIVTIFSKVDSPHLHSLQVDLVEHPSRSAPPHARCNYWLTQKWQNCDDKEDNNNERGWLKVGDIVDNIKR